MLVSMIFVTACADNGDNKSNGEHFLKEKTATIDKAKEVEAAMLNAAKEQAQAIEKQMQ